MTQSMTSDGDLRVPWDGPAYRPYHPPAAVCVVLSTVFPQGTYSVLVICQSHALGAEK